MNPNPKIEVTQEVTRQIATRSAMGASLRELSEEFSFSRPVINRILGSELGRAVKKEIIDSAVTGAVAAIKRELADMSDLALGALRKNLEEGSIEGVKVYFKALGIEAQETKGPEKSQSMTIIMPGASIPKDIETEWTSTKTVGPGVIDGGPELRHMDVEASND